MLKPIKTVKKNLTFIEDIIFPDRNAALKDFKNRVAEMRENEKPSVLQSLQSAKTNQVSQPIKTKNHIVER